MARDRLDPSMVSGKWGPMGDPWVTRGMPLEGWSSRPGLSPAVLVLLLGLPCISPCSMIPTYYFHQGSKPWNLMLDCESPKSWAKHKLIPSCSFFQVFLTDGKLTNTLSTDGLYRLFSKRVLNSVFYIPFKKDKAGAGIVVEHTNPLAVALASHMSAVCVLAAPILTQLFADGLESSRGW